LDAVGIRKYVIFNNGPVKLTGDWITTRHLSLIGDAMINTNGFNATISGNIIHDGAMQKSGAGTLTLNGTANPPARTSRRARFS
jgi:hypothetical protein